MLDFDFKNYMALFGCAVISYLSLKFAFGLINKKVKERIKSKEECEGREIYEKYYMTDKEAVSEDKEELKKLHNSYKWYHARKNRSECNTDYTDTENGETEYTDLLDDIFNSDCYIDREDLNTILKRISKNHSNHFVKLKEENNKEDK